MNFRFIQTLLIIILLAGLSVLVSCSVKNNNLQSSHDENFTSNTSPPETTISETISDKEKRDKEMMAAAKTTIAETSPIIDVMPDGKYDFLIITPEEFVKSLIPLKEHKDKTGLATKIITLEAIYQNFTGRDEAEMIKQCLAAYKKDSDMKYAMLVGDADKFPIRYTKTDRKTAEAYDIAFFPGDVYYANLFKSDGSFDDWDKNKNGYFGELGGESTSSPLNVEEVDNRLDIAVGRVPSSTADEVSTYVSKVINYELGAYGSSWPNNVLLIATTEYIQAACKYQNEIAINYLKDKSVIKLYSKDNPCEKTTEPSPATITEHINEEIGFASYIGHGNSEEWQGYYTIKNLYELINSDKLPIVFAAACGTGEFATLPPYGAYTDIKGNYHKGTDQGEIFETYPEQPACIQTENNVDGFVETIMVRIPAGAIGYIGCVTGSQEWELDLNKFFFEALIRDQKTMGDMWNYMFQRYYETRTFPENIDTPDWTVVAEFHQPWKFFLFGDPSLRIGGIEK